MAEGMRPHLGQPVIVENSPGAGGSTGVIRVARSAPDGYHRADRPVGHQCGRRRGVRPADRSVEGPRAGRVDLDAAFHDRRQKDAAAEQSQGVDRLAQGQSGQATFGNAGIGSPGHVSGIFFQNTIGAKIQPVPYRSAGPASQDLIAGNIDLMMDTAATSGPHVRNGLLKAFAMSSNKRSLAMPDVPTVDEAGLPGFYFYFWHALWVPKGTPKDVIAKLNDALVKARNDPATHKRLEDIGQEFFPADMETPEALAKFQKEEIDKWWPVIKAAGIKAQ